MAAFRLGLGWRTPDARTHTPYGVCVLANVVGLAVAFAPPYKLGPLRRHNAARAFTGWVIPIHVTPARAKAHYHDTIQGVERLRGSQQRSVCAMRSNERPSAAMLIGLRLAL